MQLDTFISETIKGIIKGVKDSQDFAKENDSRVNPLRKDMPRVNFIQFEHETAQRQLTKIDFDIAVTASNQGETGLNAGINVLSLNFGGKKTETDSNETVSRIKFEVVIALPTVKS